MVVEVGEEEAGWNSRLLKATAEASAEDFFLLDISQIGNKKPDEGMLHLPLYMHGSACSSSSVFCGGVDGRE